MTLKEKKFVETVWEYYKRHGRRSLPWRKTRDPYKILVSEVMLQQTQVERVQEKYQTFLKFFPNIQTLANASLREVLLHWQGLGYNRRAKMLHACAQEINTQYGGVFPREYKQLCALPGIGPYTAQAVLAFAFNTPVVLIETNVRSVYLYHFFKKRTDVTDAEILKIVKRTLQFESPRDWYYALMDYGSYVKKTHGNPNSKSAHYARQSRFEGSDRQIRGALLRVLLEAPLDRKTLLEKLSLYEDVRVDAQVEHLVNERMLIKDRGKLMIP